MSFSILDFNKPTDESKVIDIQAPSGGDKPRHWILDFGLIQFRILAPGGFIHLGRMYALPGIEQRTVEPQNVEYRMSKEGILPIFIKKTERHAAQAPALRERFHPSKFCCL